MMTLERPNTATHIRQIAQLYNDLREWRTSIEYLPTPPGPDPARTVEKIVGSLKQRSSIVYVRLLGRWWDIETFRRTHYRLTLEHQDMVNKLRQTARYGRGSLPIQYGHFIESNVSHEFFGEVTLALEALLEKIGTIEN